MTGFLGAAYPWVKAAHIVFVIFWMAGLFLFPRYLIHHQEVLGTPESARWAEREEKLRRVILTPSIGIVWLLGVALALNYGLFDGAAAMGWLYVKLALVFALSGFNGWIVGYARSLARGEARVPVRTLRMLNEIPALAVVVVVTLAVVKPF